MALGDLTIYQKAFDLLLYAMPILQRMPKAYRFTVVKRVEDSLLDTLLLIAKANRARDKATLLVAIDDELDRLRILCRLCNGVGLLPTDKYGNISAQLNELGRLLGGWLRQQRAA